MLRNLNCFHQKYSIWCSENSENFYTLSKYWKYVSMKVSSYLYDPNRIFRTFPNIIMILKKVFTKLIVKKQLLWLNCVYLYLFNHLLIPENASSKVFAHKDVCVLFANSKKFGWDHINNLKFHRNIFSIFR